MNNSRFVWFVSLLLFLIAYNTSIGGNDLTDIDIPDEQSLSLYFEQYTQPEISLDGDCPGIFDPYYSVAVNSKPISVFAGDFDNDNDIDIAVACYWREYCSVTLNNGNGSFARFFGLVTSYYTEWIDGADFNGDDYIDLVVADSDDDNVAIMLNNCDGTFAFRTWYSAGGNPRSVCAAKLDDDEHIDLVTANYWDGNIAVLINNGDGSFAFPVPFSAGGYPRSVFAVDINGDESLDVLTANLDSNSVSILINDGYGNFTLDAIHPVGSKPFTVIAADFNGDEDPDIAASNSGDGTVSVILSNGSGGFSSQNSYNVDGHPTSVAAIDIDNDGYIDLATANNDVYSSSILLNLGDGTFGYHTSYPTGHVPYCVKAADLDGDDDQDLVLAQFMSNYVTILRNKDLLPFEGSIAGTITNHLGEPVEGVYISPSGYTDFDSSNVDGEYIINDLCCDYYRLNFSHPDYCDTFITDIRTPVEDTIYVDIALDFRSIVGVIADQDYLPLEGAIAYIPEVEFSDTTDSDGIYYFAGMGTGPYVIEFSHPHYNDTSVADVAVSTNDSTVVDIIMSPKGFVEGAVTNETLQPIENVLVFTSDMSAYDTTDINGEYSLDYINAGNHDIIFQDTYYYDTTIAGITIISGDTTTLDIILRQRPDIEIWYGNHDNMLLNGRLGEIIGVDVYLQTAGEIPLNSIKLMLGIDNQYIDSLLSETEGDFFYPFTGMSEAGFQAPVGSPPNIAGWSSQEFNAINDSLESVLINFDNPSLMAMYVVRIAGDTLFNGDTLSCFGPGVDELGDFSVAIDSGGDTLSIIEHFSRLYIQDSYAYYPGDVNMYNGLWPPMLIGSDVTYFVAYFKGGTSSPPCLLDGFWAAADINGDCMIIGSDVIRLVAYFRGEGSVSFCGDYPPLWLQQSDIPDDAPFSWPNCADMSINDR
ncbi:MAG: VCBS repeat-containing protein [candidate division Zixibacteria bacterium]|nr:VCBS repeat-containing protein [candidate division Zixibacteria bacterium]